MVPYNSISFKYWPYIYWYEAISAMNPFKQPKRASELKLSNFKNFAHCKILSVCPIHPPTCLPTYNVCVSLSAVVPYSAKFDDEKV